MSYLTKTQAWQALQQHHDKTSAVHMRDLFQQDALRFNNFSLQHEELLLDYSKNRITKETLQLLLQLANQQQLKKHINDMFSAKPVNTSENIPALHIALRKPEDHELYINDQNIMAAIHNNLDQMEVISNQLRNKQWLGYNNKAITDIVNIGIGGSHLGAQAVVKALNHYKAEQLNFHFISNMDAAELNQCLTKLNPETTLFILTSKTFTTTETLMNAELAKKWLTTSGAKQKDALKKHFIAITCYVERAYEFGIGEDNVLPIWTWVGGRYSLWSAVGLPIAIAIGMKNYKSLLAGGHSMDEHFHRAPFANNIPVVMALLSVWYINFFNAQTQAIIPYNQALNEFPRYLQQLVMESNGKCITASGSAIDYDTGPIIFGEAGTNSQHSFHQLFLQGTQLVPVDFIMPVNNPDDTFEQQELLFNNCIAQSKALMQGNINHTDNPHHAVYGNQPSNTILLNELSPHALGMLLALYEHKTYSQAIIWGINPFDQWGVELGKQIAKDITQNTAETDASTKGLIDFFNNHYDKQ